MKKELPSFVDPISQENPSGDNIEYDSRFLELQTLSEGKPEQQYGDVIIEAQEPEWGSIEKISIQLLSESKDIRVYCYFIQALTIKYGLYGCAHGLNDLVNNIESYWDTIFPLLKDEDDEDDPYYRINSLSPLHAIGGIFKDIQSSTLIKNGLTNQNYTFKDVVNVLDGAVNVEYAGGYDRLLVDINIAADSNKVEYLSLNNILNSINKIIEIFNDKLQQDLTSEFSQLVGQIIKIIELVDDSTVELDDNKEEIDDEMNLTDSNTTNDVSNKHNGNWRDFKITSRKDVELVLEKICLYYEHYEPSHPAPLFIRRIQKQMNMDFYEIVKDLSPDSIENLENIIGINQQKNTD